MKAVVKVHKRTREIVETYPSRIEAARKNGISIGVIDRAITKGNIPFGNFYYRSESDFDPDEDFTGKSNCPVVVKDVKTGQIAWFGCMRMAAERIGKPSNQVHSCMENGHKVWGRFIVKYYGKRIA